MFKVAKPVFIKTITPLHAGSGNDLGLIDLPIQRERHTGFPKIEGSSLKGSIREAFEQITAEGFIPKEGFNLENLDNKLQASKMIQVLFGFDDDQLSEGVKSYFQDNKEFSGCLGFTDARILLFPVKSAKEIFAYVTCPSVLERLHEDLKLCGRTTEFVMPQVKPGKCSVKERSKQILSGKVTLEEFTYDLDIHYDTKLADELTELTGIQNLADRLIVLTNDDFRDYTEMTTEVITRTKISNETGTVARGALFNEEYLPAETVMYFLALASPVFNAGKILSDFSGLKNENTAEKVYEYFAAIMPEYFRIGGNATLGKGIVKTTVMRG